MTAYLLALNCGSSSLKTTLFSYPSLDEICNISASSIGSSEATLKSSFKGQKNNKSVTNESHSEIFSDVLEELNRLDGGKLVDDIGQIKIVTHRIVHGGTLDAPVRVSKGHTDALEKMEQLSAFAPLHNHHAVLTVKAVLEKLPEAVNFCCFDTLFHRSMPKHIYTYPIAQPEHEPPVPLRRYGFHGLSYANILKQVTKYLNKPVEKTNIIICHLGSGASMCVIKDGKSWDTTMGLTPLEGLPGGTRSGSLDPSLTYHLYSDPTKSGSLEKTNGDIEISKGELALNKQSGFKGLCGTNEFGKIVELAIRQEKEGNEEGRELLCVRIFKNRILNYLGSYLVALRNSPDAIIFSGGIGERSSYLRSSIIKAIDYLGIEIDDGMNEKAGEMEDKVVEITKKESKIQVLRVLTDEEKQCADMARDEFGDKLDW